MPLYGYKKPINVTVVGAALSKAEFQAWFEAATTADGDKLYVEVQETDMMMHLTDDEFQPFSASVFIFQHTDAAQQEAFIAKHEILIGTHARCVDRNSDMVNYDAPDPWLNTDDTRTIAEIHGLDKEDRWDKRTDEEKAADAEMKKMMDELKKKGELSNDDSFSPTKKKDGDVHVTDIRTSVNADGTVEIDNVLAVKVEDAKTNAVLDMKFGDKTVRVDVNWKERDIEGATELASDVYFSDKYRDEWAANLEPIFTVTTRDGAHQSSAKFQEMAGDIYADIKLDNAPGVAGTDRAHVADPQQGVVDKVLGELSGVLGQPITGINVVDPVTGKTEQSFTASGVKTEDGKIITDEDRAKNSEFLYSIGRDNDIGDLYFALVSKEYWETEGYLNDQHIEDLVVLPAGCYEMTESQFTSEAESVEELRALLEAAGFEFSQEFDDFFNRK